MGTSGVLYNTLRSLRTLRVDINNRCNYRAFTCSCDLLLTNVMVVVLSFGLKRLGKIAYFGQYAEVLVYFSVTPCPNWKCLATKHDETFGLAIKHVDVVLSGQIVSNMF